MTTPSTALRAFFDVEVRNEESMRADVASPSSPRYDRTFDPSSDVYVPDSTLGSALDSWQQAPDDIRAEWTGAPVADLPAIENDLHDLIENLGEDRLLSDLS